jgi:formylglycine-generating enzyme required for sulfatase activity
MIYPLLATLQSQGLLLSDREIEAGSEALSLLHDEDIADALWLAAKIGGAYGEVPDESNSTVEADSASSMQIVEGSTAINQPITAPPPAVAVSLPPVNSTDQQASEPLPERGLPIQVAAAPALPDRRAIGRALRPLMRKMPSLMRSELDAVATVDRIAARDIWVPILKPTLERWFDLELVIEASEFSFIWQETIAEFQTLLERQGAFRQVRAWTIVEAETSRPKLIARKQRRADESEQQLPNRSPRELVDASGRRLVLVISDCRSAAWRQGQIHDWLKLWSQHGPCAIVQLLPERLWAESELDVGFAVQVSALNRGVPNQGLQVRELPTRTTIAPADRLTLPILTLTAKALKQWALVVAAAGRQRSPARLFDLAWVKDTERDRAAGIIAPVSPEAQVELFKATASPLAQRLAGMMAAVPVDLPVVHLIQQELLPKLTPVHIAEVYGSGLLEPIEPASKQSNEPIRYDFAPEVRGLLNEATPLDETFDVIEALSQRIARTLGFAIKSFTALLSPKSSWTREMQAAILPFAQVTTAVLHRLGGDYAELAELVEQEAQGRPDWRIPPDAPEPDFPPLQVLDFVTARLVEPGDEPEESWPTIETETFTVTTIVVEPEDVPAERDLQPFEFETATVQRQGNQWVIQRQQRQADRFIEVMSIKEDVRLEMIAIPGGTFQMGSPRQEANRQNSEGPQHKVTVPAFFMGRYPITQAQWQVVAATLPQVKRELNPEPSGFKGEDRPVERVNWFDAVEFCARLSQYTGREYRLSSEAEWEYACRAETVTPFHYGATITPELANYRHDTSYNNGPTGKQPDQTTPVGQYPYANAWGLSDMHGNVWEWCADHWHGNYKGAPTDGSAWFDESDESNSKRVIRGGSWLNTPQDCRSACRFHDYPRGSDHIIGFRVVCLAPRILL